MMIAALIVSLLALLAGCGSSGPSSAVESFIKAAQDKDCNKMVDLMDLQAVEEQGATNVREELVASCQQEANSSGEIVSYKIVEEKIEGDKAEVKIEVTTKENGEEKTDNDTLTVFQRDGEWKVSFM